MTTSARPQAQIRVDGQPAPDLSQVKNGELHDFEIIGPKFGLSFRGWLSGAAGQGVTYVIQGPDGPGEFGTARMEDNVMIRDSAEAFAAWRRPSKGWRRHVRRTKRRP